MLMATMLSRVRTGRNFRFSTTSLLINLLVGYDYLLWRRLDGVELAARESRVAEHRFELGESVRIAVGGGAEHHHAERGGCGRGDTIVVGNELERDGAASGRESGVDSAQEFLVGGCVEMVQEVGDQDQVVTGSEVLVEGAARDGGIADARPAWCAFSRATATTASQSSATMCAFGLRLAISMPKRPWPAAMSRTFHFAPEDAPTSSAINREGRAIMGAMECAKSTQIGLLGS